MKFTSKRQINQISFNHSSGIGFKGFPSLCKTYTAKAYSFLFNDTTLV